MKNIIQMTEQIAYNVRNYVEATLHRRFNVDWNSLTVALRLIHVHKIGIVIRYRTTSSETAEDLECSVEKIYRGYIVTRKRGSLEDCLKTAKNWLNET